MRVITSLTTTFNSRKFRQYFSAITVNLMAMVAGTVSAWADPSIAQLKSSNAEFITENQESWLTSIVFSSAFIVTLMGIYCFVGRKYGRKPLGYLCAASFVIGSLCIMFYQSIEYLYVGRAFHGLGSAGTIIFCTLYVNEISEDSNRGTLGAFRGLFTDFGIQTMYSLGPYLSIKEMQIITIALTLLFIIIFYWLPESPTYLVSIGKEEDAHKSYMWFLGGNPDNIENEMSRMRIALQTSSQKASVNELIKSRGFRRAMSAVGVLSVVLQLSAINIAFSYPSRLLKTCDNDISPAVAYNIVGVANLVGSFFTVILTDSLGRVPLLIITMIGQALSLSTLGLYHYSEISRAYNILSIVCLFIYCVFIVAGLANLIYVIGAEMFPPEAQEFGTSFAACINWLFAFLSTKFHLILEEKITLFLSLWIYAFISLLGALYVYLYVPETKNRSRESILRELNGEPAIG